MVSGIRKIAKGKTMLIKINNYSIEPARFVAGTKGSYGVETIELEFGEEWQELSKKVVFSTNDGRAISVVYAGKPIEIPCEVMSSHGRAKFAVVGYREDVTLITVSGEIDIINTLAPDGENTVPPTETEMSQALGYMNEAINTVNELRMSVESGEFSGDKWFFGTEVSGNGTSSVFVDGAGIGDCYLNTDTCNIYRAIATDSWEYVGTLKGEKGDQGEMGTPGADYVLTEQDKNDIAKIVAEMLNSGENGLGGTENGGTEGGDGEITETEVTFTIPEFEYHYGAYGTFTVESGTTWSEWLSTNPFNDESIISFNGDNICHLPNGYYLYDSNGVIVLPTDVIRSGTYSFIDPYYAGKVSLVASQLNGTETFTFWYKEGWTWNDWAISDKDANGASVYEENNAVMWYGAGFYLCDAEGNIIPATESIDASKQYYFDTVDF